MYIPIHFIALIVLAILVSIVLTRKLRDRERRADLTGPPPRPEAFRLPPETGREVEALLARGEKIEAISLVREETRLGLREAKDLVERMQDAEGRRSSD